MDKAPGQRKKGETHEAESLLVFWRSGKILHMREITLDLVDGDSRAHVLPEFVNAMVISVVA